MIQPPKTQTHKSLAEDSTIGSWAASAVLASPSEVQNTQNSSHEEEQSTARPATTMERRRLHIQVPSPTMRNAPPSSRLSQRRPDSAELTSLNSARAFNKDFLALKRQNEKLFCENRILSQTLEQHELY